MAHKISIQYYFTGLRWFFRLRKWFWAKLFFSQIPFKIGLTMKIGYFCDIQRAISRQQSEHFEFRKKRQLPLVKPYHIGSNTLKHPQRTDTLRILPSPNLYKATVQLTTLIPPSNFRFIQFSPRPPLHAFFIRKVGYRLLINNFLRNQ